MNKALSLIAIVLFLSACTQNRQNDVPINNVNEEDLNVIENVEAYNSEDFHISFDYPVNWDVREKDSKILISSPNDRTIFNIPGESPEEFEDRNSEYIQNKLIEKIEGDSKYPTDKSRNYSVNTYLGHEGQHYIVEIKGNYINFTTDEFDLRNEPPQDNRDKVQREQFKDKLDIIVNSLSFL
jgi:hypothetical protein